MTENPRALVHQYLDGVLSEEHESELNKWIKASPENAVAFAEIARLHDQLHEVIRTKDVGSDIAPGAEYRPLHSRRLTLLGGLAALAATILLAVWLSSPTVVNASTELDRLIATSSESKDRTYRLRNLDPQPEVPEEKRPPSDGATLHVRNPDKYVLIRRFPDGRPFINGSDGELSWSIPPDGAVHVSRDPMRFRSPLPGHEHGVPFVDLRSDLIRLRDAYVVSALPRDSNGWHGLLLEKKSADYRGAKRIELWFDPATRVIHRMVFDQLPRARGGPRSVAVELLDQNELGPDYFRHESHHTTDRRIHEED